MKFMVGEGKTLNQLRVIKVTMGTPPDIIQVIFPQRVWVFICNIKLRILHNILSLWGLVKYDRDVIEEMKKGYS